MPIEECPTLYPSPEQFGNFYQYTLKLDRSFKQHFGMVKVVPPQGWKATRSDYTALLDKLDVSHPIEQNVQGHGGYFQARNIVQSRMTFRAYRKYAERESQPVRDKSASQKGKLFWKTVMYSPPIYGADLTGSLMDEHAGEWNMNKLKSLLAHAMPYRVKGVTEPYCYIGTWKAFFSWHKEDLDLSAINYIHEGEPKIWYSIAAEDGHILEAAARKHYPTQYIQCKQFLRHKTFLINPETLLKEYPTLRISKAVHHAGEMMLVFGGAYHEGFNCGFNIAQAVNYATLDWLRQLLDSHSCACSKRSVRTEIESILYNLEQSEMFEQLLATEEFMQLRMHVQRQQEMEAEEKMHGNPQTERKQEGGKEETVKTAPNPSDKIKKKRKNQSQPKSKPIKKPSHSKKNTHSACQIIQEAKGSLMELDQTKKSIGFEHL